MKILIGTQYFLPHWGGIQTVTDILANELLAQGHDVRIVTETTEEMDEPYPCLILRGLKRSAVREQVHWCDVFLQQQINMATMKAWLGTGRPLVIAMHTILHYGLAKRARQLAMRLAHERLYVSAAMQHEAGLPGTVIGNPYNSRLFRRLPEAEMMRDGCPELVAMGRLTYDKGFDLLLQSLADLRGRGLKPSLSLIGDGDARPALEAQARQLGLSEQVEFLGSLPAQQIARMLNAASLLVVPSRWAEPFGLIALEAIACGCPVIGSCGGGLPDAIGPCGETFPNENVSSLTALLERWLLQPELRKEAMQHARQHLAQYQPTAVAAKYLAAMERAIGKRREA